MLRRRNVAEKRNRPNFAKLKFIKNAVQAKVKPVIITDSVEGELIMIITVSTLQSATVVSFLSFYSFSDLQSFDADNTYLSYQLAPNLTNMIWVAVQINVLSFYLSWLMFIAWRNLRPDPDDSKRAEIFVERFRVLFHVLYLSTIIGFMMGGVAIYNIVVLQNGDIVSSQQLSFYIGLIWFAMLAILLVLCIWRYFEVKLMYSQIDVENENKNMHPTEAVSQTADSIALEELAAKNPIIT